MKKLIFLFAFIALNASAQTKTLAQDIRVNYCYLTVTDQVIVSSGKDNIMVGDIKVTMNTRDYQRSRRLQPGRTFKIKSVDGSIFILDDVIKSFCAWDGRECDDISDGNKNALFSKSRGALKIICEDRPMSDI